MNIHILNRLNREKLISDDSFEKIKTKHTNQLVSVHWDLRYILYLGILLLTSSLGILVYKNIDSIGHQAILIFIVLICAASFFYCFKNKFPYSNKKLESPNSFFDYILLLGCLTLLIFIAYLQFQYHVFGYRYGLATFIPMVLLFFVAYYFDHLAVLAMAITNLAAWVGITVTPLQIFASNDFLNSRLILTACLLSVMLIAAGIVSAKKNVKAHFEFTYSNFGMNLLFVALLAGMFNFENSYLFWFMAIMVVAFYFYQYSKKHRSFYFILTGTLYSYVGLSYVVILFLDNLNDTGLGIIYLAFLYFIISGILLVYFLMKTNKSLKA